MSRVSDDARRLDSSIDTILRGRAELVVEDEGELLTTARLLRDSLPRLHPSFSFEDLLAARLAAARRLAASGSAASAPVPLRPAMPLGAATETEAAGRIGVGAEHRRLGLVAGGAIASGVSLAGAALVVWRRSRSQGGLL